MKRKICAFMIMGAMLCTTSAVDAASAEAVRVDGTHVAVITDGKVPVREVAQALGYEVEWIAESKTVILSKGAAYVTFTVGKDGYTFAKTAPMPLGAAPVIAEGKTYVPVELFTEILALDTENDGEAINFVTAEDKDGIDAEASDQTGAARVGVAASVSEDEISFIDDEMGEVILIIGNDTEITDKNGAAIGADAIAADEVIEVVYGDAMMNSLPPRNNPRSIRATGITRTDAAEDNDEAVAANVITGTVQSNEDGLIHVVSDDEDAVYPEIVLAVSENTQGSGIDAVKGDRVEAAYSPAMTRSIPPQAEAYTVNKID